MLSTLLLAAALVVFNIYDTVITDYILRRGGRERNPLMRALYSWSRVGFYVIKNLLVFGVLGILFFGGVPELTIAVILGMGVLLIGGACVNNTVILLRRRSRRKEMKAR